MTLPKCAPALTVERFLEDGFALREQLAAFLGISPADLEERLPRSTADLAGLHPGAFDPEQADTFYEELVGDGHLLELAAWHLGSAGYIADTLRLQAQFARGQVLDFGGGIGSHALAAAALPDVDRVWFVDLNPPSLPARSDTLVCLDVLEHLADPAGQLELFAASLQSTGHALLNWYFFKGFAGEYPFHLDDAAMVERLFRTLQSRFLEVFHPWLITTRCYRLLT